MTKSVEFFKSFKKENKKNMKVIRKGMEGTNKKMNEYKNNLKIAKIWKRRIN